MNEHGPLYYQQMLIFEISHGCNLWREHAGRCPISDPRRWDNFDTSRPLTDDLIVACVTEAYRELGFRGLVAWHLYNEPTLNWPRLRDLQRRIKREVPEARFYIFTNGELWNPSHITELLETDAIWISNYSGRDYSWLINQHPRVNIIPTPSLDDRMHEKPSDAKCQCLRPFTEIIFDYFGNGLICCFDYRGHVKLPNLWNVGFRAAVTAFARIRDALVSDVHGSDVPAYCRKCAWRNRSCPIEPPIRNELLMHLEGPTVRIRDSVEEQCIRRYFRERGKYDGRLLEIGAFDGRTESLTFWLVHDGWTTVQVEPHPVVFHKLWQRHGQNPRCNLVLGAVTPEGGLSPFWHQKESGQVSSVDEKHVRHFETKGCTFSEYTVPTCSVQALLSHFGGPRNWDFVTIDAEGVSMQLAEKFPWRNMKETELVCIEHAGDPHAVLPIIGKWYDLMFTGPINVIGRRRR